MKTNRTNILLLFIVAIFTLSFSSDELEVNTQNTKNLIENTLTLSTVDINFNDSPTLNKEEVRNYYSSIGNLDILIYTLENDDDIESFNFSFNTEEYEGTNRLIQLFVNQQSTDPIDTWTIIFHKPSGIDGGGL